MFAVDRHVSLIQNCQSRQGKRAQQLLDIVPLAAASRGFVHQSQYGQCTALTVKLAGTPAALMTFSMLLPHVI